MQKEPHGKGDGLLAINRLSLKPGNAKMERNAAQMHYNRPTGQVGIHIDVYSARQSTAKNFGSEQFFIVSLTDKLFETFKEETELDKVKGIFERNELFDDVIFEGFHRGTHIVLSIGFNSVLALNETFATYKTGVIGDIIQRALVKPSILKKVGATQVTLRISMFNDEYEACKDELLSAELSSLSTEQRENGRKMIQLVKEYQKKMSSDILCLKDEFYNTEACLGELIFILKRNMPKDVDQISTYKMFESITAGLKEKRDTNQKPINQFKNTLSSAKRILQEILTNLCDRLMQVHTAMETIQQSERKVFMKRACLDIMKLLEPEYDLTRLKHLRVGWQEKILLREQKMFLGFVSLLPCAVDTITEIDQNLDEYMSAVADV